ncbi:MAG: hypothetical protein HDT13_00560 [Butyrivibrio sp.]|nr:hypothetical protein [Butyrivibrio sp.]
MKKLNGKKKLAATFAAAVMALSCTASLSAYAESTTNNGTFGGDYAIVDLDEYQSYLDTLSDAQLQLIAEKEQLASEIEAEQSVTTYADARGTLIGVPGTFTMYQQETDTYCGNACMKSVLMYTTGSSPTQAEIDTELKNKFSNIPSYANARQSKCFYVHFANPTQSELTSKIKSDITNYKVPAFLRIVTRKPVWYYDTNGHCVLSNGIYDDVSKILIADPAGDLAPDCPYFYEKPASTVADYTTAICW